MRRHALISLALGAMVATAIAGGLAALDSHPSSPQSAGVSLTSAGAPHPAIVTPFGVLPDFSGVVKTYGPAVVNISVTATAGATTAMPPPELDPHDPLYEFFRRFHPKPRNGMPKTSLGSGFIISPNGLVMTSAHVIEGADEVLVKLTDKREFKAKVIGADKLTDIAVLRIEARDLPAVRFGDPAKTNVGEWVLAIGSSFGFENSVTAGIVSAKARSLPDGGYVPFLQTDAAVNPGNSGGPLFNLSGEVIGINSQIYSRSGGYQGVSFAVPIDVALRIQEQLVRHDKARHGRLGVTIQEVSQPLARSFGLDNPVGALVSAVEQEGPAAEAGLRPGDIVLKLNGQEIVRSADLPSLIAALKPGTRVDIELWRNRAAKTLKATVGEVEMEETASASREEIEKGRLGLAVRPLTQEERVHAEMESGLVVEEALGPAARAGIQPGDIVLAVNGEPVRNAGELDALARRSGKQAALLISRNGDEIFVAVHLG